MVPKTLNDDQKGCLNKVSAEMLQRLETEPHFLTQVITDDENDRETKKQSEERHTPQSSREKKASMSK
jgi:hypothetical protein